MLAFPNLINIDHPNSEACLFQKDRNGRYQDCNQRFAEIAGLTSRSDIKGLTDDDFPWRQQSKFFHRILDYVLNGNFWMNRFQPLIIETQCRNVIISIFPMSDQMSEPCGIIGSFVDIADIKPASFLEEQDLSDILQVQKSQHEELTKSERRVFQALLSGKSNDLIGQELNLAKRTIDSYVETIKEKFGCVSKCELIAFAYSSGLAYLLKG